MLAKLGTVIVYGAGGTEGVIPASWGIQNQPTIKFIYMYELPGDAYKHAVADFHGMAIAGKLRHLPIRTFSLEATAEDKFQIEGAAVFTFDPAKNQMTIKRRGGERVFTKEN